MVKDCVCRAVYLMLLFMPFVVLAPMLLMLSRATQFSSMPVQRNSNQVSTLPLLMMKFLVFQD